ncbi:MAG: hypothetical protein ACHQVS_00545 [Candidatus Babeliales bacterium]
MAYLNNIPQLTDQLSQSQPAILGNFGEIGTWVAVNHVTFDSGANTGKHFFVEFPVPGVTPVTAAGEVGLYSQTSTFTAQPELVFSKQGGTGVYEFTSSGQVVNGGWVRHPSGILMKWGTGAPGGPGNLAINFPVAATNPAFVTAYVAFVTPTSAGIITYVNALTNLTLTVNASAAGNFNYLVIGI